MKPFQPRHVATVNIDVSSSNQRVRSHGGCDRGVRVMNNGTATVWIEFGNVAVAAALATGIPIGPGGTLKFFTGSIVGPGTGGDLYVAAIAAGSTGKIYFTPGTASNVRSRWRQP
jgi:hypothetical protein